jgi:hypothetical protein
MGSADASSQGDGMTQSIDVIIPSLGRPARLAEALRQLHAVSPDVGVIVVAEEPRNQAVAAAHGARVLAQGGNAAQKWNAGAAVSEADWFVMGSDDLLFQSGWLDAAMATDRGGYVGLRTQDSDAHEWAENYMASRTFCMEHLGGCFVIPHYLSQYLDVEAWLRATRAGPGAPWGVAVITAQVVLESLHWTNGKLPMDATYQLGRVRVPFDHQTYVRRFAAGFPDDFEPVLVEMVRA